MKKTTALQIQILSLLNELSVPERIDLVERIGKRLRQANSIASAKEVNQFMVTMKTKKKIDEYPV